jgi:hypothetical protein
MNKSIALIIATSTLFLAGCCSFAFGITARMSNHERIFILALAYVCLLALGVLMAVGVSMLKQPAKWKARGDTFEGFLVAKRVLPVSLARTLNRFESPVVVRSVVVMGLLGGIVGLYLDIVVLCRLH